MGDVILRGATMADAELLLGWRNDPDTLAASTMSAPVTWETHQAWLARTLQDSTELVWIAEHAETGAPVGTIRASLYTRGFVDGQAFRRTTRAHISLTVAPEWRGQRIGRAMLDAVVVEVEPMGLEALTAEVRDSNVASLILFVKAGYRPRAMSHPWLYLERKVA